MRPQYAFFFSDGQFFRTLSGNFYNCRYTGSDVESPSATTPLKFVVERSRETGAQGHYAPNAQSYTNEIKTSVIFGTLSPLFMGQIGLTVRYLWDTTSVIYGTHYSATKGYLLKFNRLASLSDDQGQRRNTYKMILKYKPSLYSRFKKIHPI